MLTHDEFEFRKFLINPVKTIKLENNDDKLTLDDWKYFKQIKENLITSIKQIDDIDPEKWITISKIFDFFRYLRKEVAENYNSQLTTNAWLKCYEMIYTLQLIPKVSKLNCFFNAELPGAFISAVNHYIKTQRTGMEFDWRASSLIDDSKQEDIKENVKENVKESIKESASGSKKKNGEESKEKTEDKDNGALGDQFGLYKSYPDKWLMGKKHNGDLTDVDVVIALESQILKAFPSGVHLYTSDAGFSAEADYTNQEVLHAKLNLGQILSGLLSLADTGVMITKQYTFTHPYTICLIGFVSALFDKFYIVKPMTSRPVNSESYLIGIGFKKKLFTKNIRLGLIDRLRNMNLQDLMLTEEQLIENETISSILDASREIHGILQIDQVNTIISAYLSFDGLFNKAKPVYKLANAEYLKANPIRKLDNKDKL